MKRFPDRDEAARRLAEQQAARGEIQPASAEPRSRAGSSVPRAKRKRERRAARKAAAKQRGRS